MAACISCLLDVVSESAMRSTACGVIMPIKRIVQPESNEAYEIVAYVLKIRYGG